MNVFLKAVFLLILLLGSASISRSKDLRFLHLDVAEGLSQGSVFAINQDYQGLIWIGTRDGLNKYDARKFTVYRNHPKDTASLSDNFIQSIVEDSKKRLWVGTSNGLNLYNRSLDNFVRIPLAHYEISTSSPEPSIHFIMEDHHHQIWIATNQGLYRIKEGNSISAELVFNSIPVDLGDEKIIFKNVRYLYEDSSYNLWICTDNGVLSTTYRPKQSKKLKVNRAYPIYSRGKGATDNRAVAMLEVRKNEFWVATKSNGILVLNDQTGEMNYRTHIDGDAHTLPSNDIRSIVKDRKGRLWIGTFNGLSLYAHGQFKNFYASDNDQYSLSNNSIRPIFQDKRGSIWIGTYFGGVNIMDDDIPTFKNFSHLAHHNSLSYNVVSSFEEDDKGHLIVGTEGGGINYLDRNRGQFSYAKHESSKPSSLSHNHVKSLCLDRDGNLWVGTYEGGLDFRRRGSDQFEHIKHNPRDGRSLSNNRIYALLEDRAGDLWVGTFGGGLNVKRKGSNKHEFERYTLENKRLSSNMVRAIYEDSKGNLWVGTQNGLNLKRRGSENFEFFTTEQNDPQSLSGNAVISIYEDNLQQVWIGTYMNGLNLYHPEDNSFTHFDENNGLPGNNIFGILSDKNNHLWLSTNAGIACFNPLTGAVRNYNTIDGLIGNEFIYGSHYKMSDGHLVFGSSMGFTLFNPDSISVNHFEPPVIFTGLRLFNKRVLPDKEGLIKKDISLMNELVLDYKQYVFSIEFSVLNYIHSDKNKYAYLLKGFDDDWNFVGTPVANYTNLDPGTYELMVKGTNNDGIWNNKPSILKIRILPPPWKTWWAYTLYLLIVGVLGYFIVRFLKGRNKLKHELLLEHLALQKQKEIHEAKLNFFTNISHEFRTPLSLIVGPVERLLSDGDIPHSAKPLLNNAHKNANRLLNLVNQLLDFRKQESGNLHLQISQVLIIPFLKEMISDFLFLAEKKNISIHLKAAPDDGFSVWIDREQLAKVIINLLYNAFKFTDQGGEIKICLQTFQPSVSYPEGYYTIDVWDTGHGIDEQNIPHIFDQFYQSNSHYEDHEYIGSGIGLALAKSLVKMHEGNISVKSNLATHPHDFNTVFSVELPLGKMHFTATQVLYPQALHHNDSLNEDRISISEGPSLDILEYNEINIGTSQPVLLIVEDNVELRRFIVESLQGKFKILEAGDGLEAWSIMEYAQPDMVITDVMMPKSDGIALLQKIKTSKSTNHIPVILLTARTANPHIMEAFQEGSDDYITKPFSIRVLMLKINNILETRKRLREKFVCEYLLQPHKVEAVETNSFLDEVIAIIEASLTDDDFSVNVLAQEVGVSRTVLYRKIKQLSGLNLVEFIKAVRLKKASQLLKAGTELTISEIAYQVGFSDPKYFSKSFKSVYKMSPKEYAHQQIT